jgi:excisionase family DNA binding protein
MAVTTTLPPLLLNVDEAAAYLNCSRRHIERLLATGQLRSLHLGRLRRIPRLACDELAAQLEQAQ